MRAKLAIVCYLVAARIVATSTDAWGVDDSTNAAPQAFLKGRQLRLYFTSEGERVMFSTKWKKLRLPTEDFSYTVATLKRENAPGALPSPSSSWREIKVIEAAEGDRFLRKLAMHLAPAEKGHGVHSQYAMGDAVLFRDPAGNVRLVPFEAKPADVIIDRRYGRHELAATAAGFIEQELRAAYPNATAFVLLWNRRGAGEFIAVLDLAEREALACYPPPDDAARGAPKLVGNLRNLSSFVLKDHAWAFLKNPVSSTSRTLHQALQWTGTFFEPKLRQQSAIIPPVANAPGMDLAEWEQWLDRHTGTPRERGAIRPLINGEKFFPHFERRVAEAQSCINVHVCIFDRDDIAVQVADMLKARSSSIEVKVILDRLNSRGAGTAPPATPMPEGFVAPRFIEKYLREGGQVQVHPQLNPGFTCDHSKVFLIDERFAYIGGMNFGREYRYEWHDLMAEVEGPVVSSLQREFDKKWAQTGLWGDCGLAAQSVCGELKSGPADEPADSVELRRLYTKTFNRQIRQAQLEAIGRARSYVFLENAYLYSNDMIVALVRARLRGVDVRVILPGENDFAPGHGSNIAVANYLRRHGVRVYFYPGMSHVKALQVDGWVCFGSANSDALSLRLNREANLASSDAGFASRFRQEVFETDFARSRELKEDIETGWGDHVADAFLNLF
ncbi:MAG: phosphatidylserine/phosphatidylglycerophosphate/cardiolipin synthase family protein [Verrucomicrobia bacterium]|nr:phosphatidylserine/phosphatidylglycerophosphate/cardiolipin synthase family protein [Verrucomicrobiota bacterium]